MTHTAPMETASARARTLNTHNSRLPLWDHQEQAIELALHQPGCILAIGMGGGKSRCAIEIAERTHASNVLVVCPKSVVGVWPREIREHAHRPWHIWAGRVPGRHGKPLTNPSISRRAAALVDATKHAIVTGRPLVAVVNFESCWRTDMGNLLAGTDWDLLVIDESHRIKLPSGQASKHLARIAARVRSRGGRVICQTGTPMPHTPLDVWAQMRTVDGGQRLGTNYHRFCQSYGAGEQIYTAGGVQRTIYKGIRPDRLDEFTRRVDEVMFQAPQNELDRKLGLPETVDLVRTCDLQPATRKVYEHLERDLIADLDTGVVTAANAMVLTLRLAQLSGGFAKDPDGRLIHISDPPEKAQLLADILYDLDEREPVIVFCRFHADLDAIRTVAEGMGRRYAELSGRRRDGLTDDSRMAPDADLVGVQLKSGGVGIDFTRARYGIYYTLAWELADYEQSRKRLHRPGQTRRTTYIHLLANDTVDWAMWGALRKRRNIINDVLKHINKETTP